jgi:N-glycosylase/DNA lyase
MGEFTINTEGTPFNLRYTLESGQSFRWQEKGQWWVGVLGPGVVKVRQEGAALVCVSSTDSINSRTLFRYLGLEEDLQRVLSSIMRDARVTEAVQQYYGLRLLRQDVWECLLSFVVATNSNIPRIKGMISNLCGSLGEPIKFEDQAYALFPTPQKVAEADTSLLEECGLGYRARFVKSVGEAVHQGALNLEELRFFDYPRAKEALTGQLLGRKTLMGVGPKAADCILLFSCDKLCAFPIDVWMAKVLSTYYPHIFPDELKDRLSSKVEGRTSLSEDTYERLAAGARTYFGEFAGYAQQYLFHHERNEA